MSNTELNATPYTSHYFEELEEGMVAELGKVITNEDIVEFAELSCDTNPVHLDDAYAATTPFKTRIAHGSLCASFISAILGTQLPGPGCIYISQNLRFKAPVRIGDRVTAQATIVNLIPSKRFVEIKTQCLVGDKVVIDGEAMVMVPSKAS